MAGSLLPQPKQIAFDNALNPGIAYQFYTYESGSLTPKATYQDAGLSAANTNPAVANARGEVVMYGTGSYRVILKDALGNTIWDRDNIEAQPSFIQAGTGAVSRTQQDKQREVVSVLDFGAKTDGTDCSTAIQNAINSLPAAGGAIRFPAGSYVFCGVTINKPLRIIGDGGSDGGVTWINPAATTPTFSANGISGIYLENFKITASTIRTGGKYIDFVNCNRVVIEKFYMTKYYVGIGLDGGSEITIDKFQMFDGVAGNVSPNSGAILCGDNNYTGSLSIDNGYIKCQDGTKQCSYGIRLKFVDVVKLGAGLTLIGHGDNLHIIPQSGQTAALIRSYGVTYDTAINGVRIAPGSGGSVIRCDFSGGWYGVNSVAGIVIDGSVGAIDAVSFRGGEAMGNSSCGINAIGPNAKNITVRDMYIAGCGVGIRTDAAVDIYIDSNVIGNVGQGGGNVTGLTIASNVTGYATRNRFVGNTTGISGSSAGFSTSGNIGA